MELSQIKPNGVSVLLVDCIFCHPDLVLCSYIYGLSSYAECLGAFDDFNLVCGDRVPDNAQYIIPELSFSCDGTVTQWKVGMEDGGNDRSVNLQIWRSVGAGEYSSVTEVVYTKTGNEMLATVPVSMSVMAGDMVGFYVPGGQLQLHTVPDVGLTMYTTGGSPTSSVNALDPLVGPSPYISVVFGRFCSSLPKYIYTCVLKCKGSNMFLSLFWP